MIKDFIKKSKNTLVGWFETHNLHEYSYNYVIDHIELREQDTLPKTYIHYKLIGCRTLFAESVTHLNHSHLFAHFRPDHAQIIVSIATIEALLDKAPKDILPRYKQYTQQCAYKIRKK